ncbi:uncharacterized protein LOC129771044 [Toxorhynchites rutilus septentrionalis]|uniref:uncharacterized protein LOC129771044 n=1 Tax=Toxorhynchites rutilus septentrionalis TaxID=329112 RepID=UPI00247902DD|nr:uncharacterized protein LOC129771044 [Toxorhynchites rutilus septentrionalis]
METEMRAIPSFYYEQIERSRLAKEWKSWKGTLECYFEAHNIDDQKIMRAKMLYLGGPQLQRVFANLLDTEKFPMVAIEKRWYDLAVEKLDNFFKPVRQDTLERHRLRAMKQKKDEHFAQYVLRLRQQISECGLEKYPLEISTVLTEITLIDVIVQGCLSNELRSRILKKDQTLSQIEALGAMIESVEEQVKSLSSSQLNDERVYHVEEQKIGGLQVPKFDEAVHRTVKNSMIRSNQNPHDRVACFSCGRHGHFSNSPHCPARVNDRASHGICRPGGYYAAWLINKTSDPLAKELEA